VQDERRDADAPGGEVVAYGRRYGVVTEHRVGDGERGVGDHVAGGHFLAVVETDAHVRAALGEDRLDRRIEADLAACCHEGVEERARHGPASRLRRARA
jgi:hypothetical protein